MQKCITWTKNIQKGAQALQEVHIHWRIKEKRLLTLVLNQFAFLIYLFIYLLNKKTCY